MYKFIPYGVSKETENNRYTNWNGWRRAQSENDCCGASAYSRIIEFSRMASSRAGSRALLSWTWRTSRNSCGRMHPSPVPHADFVPRRRTKLCAGRAATRTLQTQFAKELDRITFPGTQGGPLMHIIAAKRCA